jgi:phosphoglycolate phosphatase-like HAD superfamily hydrolase
MSLLSCIGKHFDRLILCPRRTDQMMIGEPDLLALDFDGVICDGLKEYFQTAWRAHCQLWAPDVSEPPLGLAEAFYRLRPIVETGWEMPVVIHALRSGFTEREILQDWHNLSLELVQHHRMTPQAVGQVVDRVRDRWIAEDLSGWLAEHQFYPGVVDWLKTLGKFVIISTKESRFIQQLLLQVGIEMPSTHLFGKEQQRPKYTILRELKPQYRSIWFVEDRFKTLEKVIQQPDLGDVKLFLADWGYNLPSERETAQRSDRVRLISLAHLPQGFSSW